MYIDIALTPLEESLVLATLFTLVLVILVLLFRPRLFTRGLAPIVALAAGNTAVVDSRRTSRRASVAVVGDILGGGGGGGGTGSPSFIVDGLTTKRWSSFILLHLLNLYHFRRTITKTYTRLVLIIRDNPDDFGSGWSSYLPIPTLGVWTTFPPLLSLLGRMFEVDIREVMGRVDQVVGGAVVGEEEGEEGGAGILKERKGSVGLGIVGVDVVTPITTTTNTTNSANSNNNNGTGMTPMIIDLTNDNPTDDPTPVNLDHGRIPVAIRSQIDPHSAGSLGTGLDRENGSNGIPSTTSPKSTFRFSESYDLGTPPRAPIQTEAEGGREVGMLMRGSSSASPPASVATAVNLNWMSDPFARGRELGEDGAVEGEGQVGKRSSSFPVDPSIASSSVNGIVPELGPTPVSFATVAAGLKLSPTSTSIGPGGSGSFKTFSEVDVGTGVGASGRPHRRSRSSPRTDLGCSVGEPGILSPSKMNKVFEREEEDEQDARVGTNAMIVPPPLEPQQPELIPFTPFPDRIERSRAQRTSRWLVRKGKRMLVFSYAKLAGPIGLGGVATVVGMVTWEMARCWWIIARMVWVATVGRRREEVVMRGGMAGVETARGLIKRGMMDTVAVQAAGTSGPPSQEGLLRAIIPGWTVPLSHIFPIVGTLIACQVIHESGHVIAAAMDSITPTRLGLNLHLILPAASVTFPKTVSDLTPTSRLRMAASGPWNNLLTWSVLTLIASTRLWTFVYHDYSDQGRVVLNINSRSALSGHIPVGSIVEYLDDTPLRGERDHWSEYLWNDVFDETRGWCIDKKRYLATQKAPCPPAAPVQFTSLPSNATNANIQCLPPYPLLTSRTWSCPCSSPLKICVKPLASENIMRIQWRDARAGVGGLLRKEEEVESIVVLWSGEKREVWDSMRVSRWAGKGGMVGRRVIGWIELIFGYTAMLSLSLALLNLLPLPRLDGAHMVEAVLDRLYPSTSKARPVDSPGLALEKDTGDHGEKGLVSPTALGTEKSESSVAIIIRRRNIERGIEFGVIGLTVLMLGGQVLVWLL